MFCAASTVAILFRLNDTIGSEHEIMELKRIVYAYLGMLATDIVYAFNESGLLTLNPFVYAANNAATITCVTLGCYFWFRYVEDRLRQDAFPKRYARVLITIPLVLVIVLDVISIFTGWIFYIDENGSYQASEPFFFVQAVVNYAYLLIPTVEALWMSRKTKSKTLRREYLFYPVYMIVPLICGMLEDELSNVPILALCIFMIILIYFLSIQSRQVSSDALTGLNNRRWLRQYLGGKLETASVEKPIALFMIDINGFGTINNLYGYIEGDNALRSFATALRMTATRYNAFAARFGDDEFCLVIDVPDRSPEEIAYGIEVSLQTALSVMEVEKKPYTLSVSIGHAICDHSEARVDEFIERARDVLEEDQARHRHIDPVSA